MGNRGQPKPKLSPLPRGGLAAAQGEEVGSNERSWPGTGRPSSAQLNSLANAQPPKLQRRERGAGHLSLCLSPSPPKAAIFFPSPFLPLTVQAKEKFKRRRRSNQKGMKVQPKQKPCYGQKSANSLYCNGCRTRFSHGLRKTNFQLLSLSLPPSVHSTVCFPSR